ncbi:MAG: glycosyltransferase family 2 protein [Lachnospiraceae bacterium]|nr:glycosyltransferase family 2 protein [Lachnospiraceae bacterium]
MMEDKISIIVPVYKVENFVERCIKSVLNQTYTNWEMIMVEDGSPDGSGAICDSYAEKDSRIHVIHKENQGVAAARNTGLQMAKGTYIAFVDSDDYVHPDYLKVMMELQKETDALLSIVGFHLSHDSQLQDCKPRGNAQKLTSAQMIEMQLNNQQLCSPWSKLYHRSIFEQLSYPEGDIYEDLMVAIQIFDLAKDRIVYQDVPLYYYFQESESITRCDFHYGKLDELKALEHQYLYVAEKYPHLVDKARYEYVYHIYGYILCLVKDQSEKGKAAYASLCKSIAPHLSFMLQYGNLTTKQKLNCHLIKHPKFYRTFVQVTGKK